MIDRKYHKTVFSFFMSLLMSSIMSLVISIFNIGLVNNIISIWLGAWAFSFSIAFPAIIIVSPLVHKLVSMVLKEDSSVTIQAAPANQFSPCSNFSPSPISSVNTGPFIKDKSA